MHVMVWEWDSLSQNKNRLFVSTLISVNTLMQPHSDSLVQPHPDSLSCSPILTLSRAAPF